MMIINKPLFLLASYLAVAIASAQPASTTKVETNVERLLQDPTTGSSDLLQEVVSELTLLLPDFELTERILFNDLTVAATNVECVDLSLGNFQVSVPNSKNDELTLQVDASQLDVVCTMNYDFSYTAILFPLTGKGTLTMVLNDNTLSAGFNFVTDGEKFDTHPPYNVTMDACEAIFTIDDMEFMQSEGSTSSDMLDSMDGLIRGFVEESIGEKLCEEFGGEMEWVLRDMVEGIYGAMEPYLGELQEVPNRDVVVSAADGVKLINYTASKAYNEEEDLLTQLTNNNQEQPWLTTLVGYVNNLGLGEMDPDENDLKINVLMREYLLEEDTGALTVENIDELPFLTDLLESNLESFADDDDDSFSLPVNATLNSLSIYGLDSFTNFALLEASNAYTLNNELRLGYLRLEITFRLESVATDMGEESLIGDPNGALERVLKDETMKLTFQMDDIQINAAVLLAIDEDLFGQLGLGSILYNTDILMECLQSSVVRSELSTLQVQIGNLATPTLESSLLEASPMLSNALTTVVEAGMTMYENAILRLIPNMVQTTLQDLLNDSFFSNTNADSDSPTACPQLAPTGNEWLDFRDLLMEQAESRRLGGSGSEPYGSLVPYLYNFGMSFLANPSNIASLFTLATSDLAHVDGTSLSFPGEVMGDQLRIWLGNLDARISYSVFDIRLDNMVNSIGEPIVMLNPVMNEPTFLNNSITAGVNDKPLRLSARVMLDVKSNIETISNHFIISADVGSLAMTLTALLKVMEDRYSTFPIRDLFHLDCWMAMILPPLLNEYGVREDGEELNAGIHAMSILAQEINMDIECLVCSSPGLVEMEELWSTPDIQNDFTEIGNSLFGGAADIGEKFLQLEVDRRLNEAAFRCPHSPQYDETFDGFSFQQLRVESTQDESSSLAMLLVIAIACGVVVVGGVVFGVRWFVRRRHAKWLRTLPNERLALLAKRQVEEDFKESELNRTSNSMFQSQDEIPKFFRYAIPLVILGNIALFLSGHFNVAAEVSIVASFAGQELAISDVYAFSMARSAVEIWNAGGYILSLGILVFAGIWPYTRQILFLSLWFLPPEKCSISRRGLILNWLDALAKWSIVDIFTVIVTVVAFRLSIQNPETMILPSEFYSFDLLVHPVWGLYANLIAQLISQISSHIIIHYHRNIVHEATQSYRQKQACTVPDDESAQTPDTYGDKRDSLSNLKFSRPHKAEAEKLVVRRIVHYAIPIGALAACVFIILGCILPSVGLEFFGLLGVAVEVGQDGAEASRELSALGLIGMLMDQAGYIGNARSYIGLFFLSGVFFITVLVVPLIQSAVLLYQWSWPMTGKMRKRVSVAIEYLQAWQYAEVYVISVIVASWQLGDISAHLFNDYCESSVEFLNTLAYFEVIGENDTQCFRTNASIMGGCYLMAVGALFLALFNSYVNSACHQYFRSRDEEIDHETQEVGWNKDVEASTPTTVKAANDFDVEVSTPTTEKGAYDFETVDTTDGTSPSPSYDETTNQKATAEGKAGNINGTDNTSKTSYYDKIRPTRVLFSDRFRWTLCSASDSISSQ